MGRGPAPPPVAAASQQGRASVALHPGSRRPAGLPGLQPAPRSGLRAWSACPCLIHNQVPPTPRPTRHTAAAAAPRMSVGDKRPISRQPDDLEWDRRASSCRVPRPPLASASVQAGSVEALRRVRLVRETIPDVRDDQARLAPRTSPGLSGLVVADAQRGSAGWARESDRHRQDLPTCLANGHPSAGRSRAVRPQSKKFQQGRCPITRGKGDSFRQGSQHPQTHGRSPPLSHRVCAWVKS